MKLSPQNISAAAFASRMSGYDKTQVRDYLRELSYGVETLMREHEAAQRRVQELQSELQARRQAEEEMRRALMAAERMAYELRETASKEAAVILEQAQTQAAEQQREQAQRSAEAELQHQQRLSELDTAFRSRYVELERDHHEWVVAREREHHERLSELERQYAGRYQDLSERFTTARQEYAQFLTTYRAVVSSFGELSLRHSLPEELSLGESAVPVPVAMPTARLTSEVMQAMPDVSSELAEALMGAALPSFDYSSPALLGKDILPPHAPLNMNTPEILSHLPDAVPLYGAEPDKTK